MSVLFWLISNPSILAILAGIVGAFGWGIKQRRVGRAEGEAKLAKAREKAATELYEMDREATDAEKQARDLTDSAAREEALKWRKS